MIKEQTIKNYQKKIDELIEKREMGSVPKKKTKVEQANEIDEFY